MELLLVIVVVAVLDAAALLWGSDSRPWWDASRDRDRGNHAAW